MVGSNMLPMYHGGLIAPSRLGPCRRISQTIRTIFEEKDSRNLFLFLLVNFSFAFVELVYGIWSNSLGLITDSFHMFFDCSALLGGLVASMIARKPANSRYSYGYQRAEVLGGFVNGLFLVFIAFFVFKEALERFFDPPHVHSHRLLPVAVLGLFVNFIGIFVFQHGGHGHSHGGGGHGHAHGGSSKKSKSCDDEEHHRHGHGNGHGHAHGHGHGHGNGHDDHHDHHDHHGHSHGHGHDSHYEHSKSFDHHDDHCESSSKQTKKRNYIMDGVLLHVLADTLGSVGVIISSILIHQFGWMVADPICSLFISIMIFMSTIPLLRASVRILMQRTPDSLDLELDICLQNIQRVEGVIRVRDCHFWTLSEGVVIGSLVVVIRGSANDVGIKNSIQASFREAGVTQLTVQTDRDFSFS